jgi:hypothetical protein
VAIPPAWHRPGLARPARETIMSTATLNVWITAIGEPCHIASNEWFVNIVDCEGKVLEWCGKVYREIPARCGHVEIEIPPGCYAVFAVENPNGIPPFGNQLTHIQIVRANCGDHVCVTLFAPSAHLCGSWFGNALRGNLSGFVTAGIPRQTVLAAIDAVDKVVQAIPAGTFSTNLAPFGRPEGKS